MSEVINFTYDYQYDVETKNELDKLSEQLINNTNKILTSLLVIL